MFDAQTNDLVGTYCGTNVPHPMTFKDSVIMIFKTDYYFTDNGFEIQYAVKSKKTDIIFDFQNCSLCVQYASLHAQLIF